MEFEERAADPLAGGLMRGYQCGMTWGAALAAGAQSYRHFGPGPLAETMAIRAAQRVVETFRAQNKSIDCSDVTGIDMASPTFLMAVRFLVKSAASGSCFGMAARYAPAAFDEINAAFSQEQKAPPAPVSCAAVLAQKMGASEIHTVMAAGLAGGIGLSGGGCGALGAAIWIVGMNVFKQGGKMGFQAPYAIDAVDRFAKCTDHKFECAKIVGRKFASIDDHASYLRDGGCARIIKELATYS